MAAKNILFIGCGDLIKKAAPSVAAFKTAGYKVIATDYKSEPIGRDVAKPDLFFDCSQQVDHEEFLRIARTEEFEAAYVANPGNAHLTSAVELQHFTKRVIISKPVDTHVGLVSTVRRHEDVNYRYLLPKVSVHDHYLNKPGVRFLQNRLMPHLHAEHYFLSSIQMFLVEKKSIEEDEPHRLAGLSCGMIFDLAVHMASILDLLMPRGASWLTRGGLTHTRSERKIEVVACETGRFGGTFLDESTVLPGRKAETFGIVEFQVHETVISSAGHQTTKPVRVLIVVGKGVPIDPHATRDLKSIVLKFQGGYEATLDVDTHRFLGVDDATLRALGYYDLDFNQKGINGPLVEAAQSDFAFTSGNPFQQWGPASSSVLALYQALTLSDPEPVGYEHEHCRGLIDRLLRSGRNFSRWSIPDNLYSLVIGPALTGAVA